MKIICKSGVGQPVNPHEEYVTLQMAGFDKPYPFKNLTHKEFSDLHPPLPCYLPNGEVCPDGEYEGDTAAQVSIEKVLWFNKESPKILDWNYERQIYLCKSDTEADIKKEKEQNSPEDFKAKAIEKLISLKRRYKAFPESCDAINEAISAIKAL